MTRISSVNDPAYQIELLKGRVEALERRNPLNSASIDPDVPGISAGSNVFNSSGFQFMWGGELRSMGSVAAGLNSKADGIQAYAEDIDARQSVKPTTAWVQAQINALQSQIDNAAGSGDVAAVQTELTNFKIDIVQFLSELLTVVEFKSGETPPPLPTG